MSHKIIRNRYANAECESTVIRLTQNELNNMKKRIAGRHQNPFPTPEEREQMDAMKRVIEEFGELVRHNLLIASVCGPDVLNVRPY